MGQRRQRLVILALVMSLSSSLAYDYVARFLRPRSEFRLAAHQEIINKTALSPYAYRVLLPWTVEVVARTADGAGLMPYKSAVSLVYYILDLVDIFLLLVVMYFLFREWYPSALSLLGVFYCAALMPLALRDHIFQPWSLLEAGLFGLALLLTRLGRYGPLVAVTVIAALNRETGIFIPVIYFLGAIGRGRPGERRRLAGPALRTLILLATAVSVLALVRFIQGSRPSSFTVGQLWARNTSPEEFSVALIHWTLFLGIAWVFAVRGLRRADPFLRRQALLIPVYIATIAVFGIWKEVRLLLPLYPLLIALALRGVPGTAAFLEEGGRRTGQAAISAPGRGGSGFDPPN